MCYFLVLLPGSQIKVAKAEVAVASICWGTGSIAVSSSRSSSNGRGSTIGAIGSKSQSSASSKGWCGTKSQSWASSDGGGSDGYSAGGGYSDGYSDGGYSS